MIGPKYLAAFQLQNTRKTGQGICYQGTSAGVGGKHWPCMHWPVVVSRQEHGAAPCMRHNHPAQDVRLISLHSVTTTFEVIHDWRYHEDMKHWNWTTCHVHFVLSRLVKWWGRSTIPFTISKVFKVCFPQCFFSYLATTNLGANETQVISQIFSQACGHWKLPRSHHLSHRQ